MAFSELEIKKIWELFALRREELEPNSTLRQCCADLEQWDSDYSGDLVGDVQSLLSEIDDIDNLLEGLRAQSGQQSVSITGEISITYKNNSGPTAGYLTDKGKKLTQIRQILQMDRYTGLLRNTAAKVIGISAGHGEQWTVGRYH